MDNHRTQKQIVIDWILPTMVQVAVYIVIVGLTIFLSSQNAIDQLLFSTGNFNPVRAGIGFFDALFQGFFGEKIAGGLSLAVFWGAVGLIVNIFWWIGSNFSTELNNDLVYSKYVHPQDIDPKAQLRELVEKTIIRTTVAFIGLGYLNYFMTSGLPLINTRFASVIESWELSKDYSMLIGTIIMELGMLHLVTMMVRLVLLRKKTIDS